MAKRKPKQKPQLKKYTLAASTSHVVGTQWWSVIAASEEEALSKFKAGDCEFEDEELEVQDFDDPEIIATEDYVQPPPLRSIRERIEALVFYGTGDEAYEEFQATCEFCYRTQSDDWKETVCDWAEVLAKISRSDYIDLGGDPDAADADKANGVYGNW